MVHLRDGFNKSTVRGWDETGQRSPDIFLRFVDIDGHGQNSRLFSSHGKLI